jgi:uncharacterized protein
MTVALANADPREADDWFQTYTGVRFPINNPRPELVRIEDIAHALAHICRYGGHVKRFYSVAEHSYLIARYANEVERRPRDEVYHALLHDAAEAYTGDIKRPIKNAVPVIRQAVKRVESVVAHALRIPDEKPQWLTDLDTRIVADEKSALLGHPEDGTPWGHEVRGVEPLGVRIVPWAPAVAEQYFLSMYRRFKP